jgi:exodeoxyribonuclease VIII
MILEIMPEKEYHAHPALGASNLRRFIQSPLKYKYEQQFPAEDDSHCLEFGSAVHLAVLQPSQFANNVAVQPKFDRRTKAGKEGFEEFLRTVDPNKILMSEGDIAKCANISNAIHASALWKNIVLPTKPKFEVSIFQTLCGVDCKARFDILPTLGHLLVDLKTTKSASKWSFRNSIVQYGYHIQAAYYSMIYEAEFGVEPSGFAFLAVEKTGPYDFAMHELSRETLQKSKELVKESLLSFAACSALNDWQGYPKHETVIVPELPQYAFEKGDYE